MDCDVDEAFDECSENVCRHHSGSGQNRTNSAHNQSPGKAPKIVHHIDTEFNLLKDECEQTETLSATMSNLSSDMTENCEKGMIKSISDEHYFEDSNTPNLSSILATFDGEQTTDLSFTPPTYDDGGQINKFSTPLLSLLSLETGGEYWPPPNTLDSGYGPSPLSFSTGCDTNSCNSKSRAFVYPPVDTDEIPGGIYSGDVSQYKMQTTGKSNVMKEASDKPDFKYKCKSKCCVTPNRFLYTSADGAESPLSATPPIAIPKSTSRECRTEKIVHKVVKYEQNILEDDCHAAVISFDGDLTIGDEETQSIPCDFASNTNVKNDSDVTGVKWKKASGVDSKITNKIAGLNSVPPLDRNTDFGAKSALVYKTNNLCTNDKINGNLNTFAIGGSNTGNERNYKTPSPRNRRPRTYSCPGSFSPGSLSPAPLEYYFYTPRKSDSNPLQASAGAPSQFADGAGSKSSVSKCSPALATFAVIDSPGSAVVDLTQHELGHRRRVLVLPRAALSPDPVTHSNCGSAVHSRQSSFGDTLAALPVPTAAIGRHLATPRRGRALSCDVTLEETVGRTLRNIADQWETSLRQPIERQHRLERRGDDGEPRHYHQEAVSGEQHHSFFTRIKRTARRSFSRIISGGGSANGEVSSPVELSTSENVSSLTGVKFPPNSVKSSSNDAACLYGEKSYGDYSNGKDGESDCIAIAINDNNKNLNKVLGDTIIAKNPVMAFAKKSDKAMTKLPFQELRAKFISSVDGKFSENNESNRRNFVDENECKMTISGESVKSILAAIHGTKLNKLVPEGYCANLPDLVPWECAITDHETTKLFVNAGFVPEKTDPSNYDEMKNCNHPVDRTSEQASERVLKISELIQQVAELDPQDPERIQGGHLAPQGAVLWPGPRSSPSSPTLLRLELTDEVDSSDGRHVCRLTAV